MAPTSMSRSRAAGFAAGVILCVVGACVALGMGAVATGGAVLSAVGALLAADALL